MEWKRIDTDELAGANIAKKIPGFVSNPVIYEINASGEVRWYNPQSMKPELRMLKPISKDDKQFVRLTIGWRGILKFSATVLVETLKQKYFKDES